MTLEKLFFKKKKHFLEDNYSGTTDYLSQLGGWLVSEVMCAKSFYKMISVSSKVATNRVAIATGKIFVGEKAFNLIKKDQLPKGNSLILSEIAGINAAKVTPSMLPLCHPLNLDCVAIYHELDEKNHSIDKAKSNAKKYTEHH